MPTVPDMDMRDWFAALALNGMLSQSLTGGPPVGGHVNIKSLEPWVKRAYDFADLMIQEREKKRSHLSTQAGAIG